MVKNRKEPNKKNLSRGTELKFSGSRTDFYFPPRIHKQYKNNSVFIRGSTLNSLPDLVHSKLRSYKLSFSFKLASGFLNAWIHKFSIANYHLRLESLIGHQSYHSECGSSRTVTLDEDGNLIAKQPLLSSVPSSPLRQLVASHGQTGGRGAPHAGGQAGAGWRRSLAASQAAGSCRRAPTSPCRQAMVSLDRLPVLLRLV